MSITLTYTDAANYIQRQVPKMAEADMAGIACNVATNEIWKKYDWRESLAILPPFSLTPLTQDYGPPANVVPKDFMGLREAYVIQLNSNPAIRYPMRCMKDLQLTHVQAIPGDICYQPSKRSFRVFPRVPDGIGAPSWCITGEYKKRPTAVTPNMLSATLLPFDDIYFLNFTEVLLWAAWKASGDQRAGGAQHNSDGGTVYSGQYAIAHEQIDMMAANENLELGDVSIAPAEPLALTSQNWYSGTYSRLFGW